MTRQALQNHGSELSGGLQLLSTTSQSTYHNPVHSPHRAALLLPLQLQGGDEEQQCPERQRGLAGVTQGSKLPLPQIAASHSHCSPHSLHQTELFSQVWLGGNEALGGNRFFVPPDRGMLETGVISYASRAGSRCLISKPLVYSIHLYYWFKRVCPAIIALTRSSA